MRMDSCLRALPLIERNAHKLSSGLPRTIVGCSVQASPGLFLNHSGSTVVTKGYSARFSGQISETCYILNNFFYTSKNVLNSWVTSDQSEKRFPSSQLFGKWRSSNRQYEPSSYCFCVVALRRNWRKCSSFLPFNQVFQYSRTPLIRTTPKGPWIVSVLTGCPY
jgi:hypothetical protein